MVHHLAPLLLLAALPAQEYVVVTGDRKGGDFYRAAEILARHHRARILTVDMGQLDGLRTSLRKIGPRWVAYVLRPEQIDFHVSRCLLQMATEIDTDPFVDFEYGFFTGATGDETCAFVKRCIAFKPGQKQVKYGRVSGGATQSREFRQHHALRKTRIEVRALHVAGKKQFPDEGRDRVFIAKKLPGLEACNLLMFVGHGVPREIVGGPDWRDLARLELPGAVVLNVGCYTGVTSRFFERDWQKGLRVEKTVPLAESFALGILRSGVIGYTAYTCPRPAGPELDTDLGYLVTDGLSLGAARRRDYDKTVLGFLGYGESRLDLARVKGGTRLHKVTDAVRDMMLEGATGGILFGDPALRPFARRPGDALVATSVRLHRRGLKVVVDCPGSSTHLVCSDPTARIGRLMALKAYTRVALGRKFIRNVSIAKVRIGGRPVASTRLIWAFEEDRGKHFAQIKVMIERPGFRGALRVELQVATCTNATDAKNSGGTPPTAGAAKEVARSVVAVDLASTKITAAMRERITAWKVTDAALTAALAATKATLTRRIGNERRELKRFGSEGFRALCLLLEIGHHHHRTVELLELTHEEGDFEHLMRLRERRPLPRYGDWTLMDALGIEAQDRAKAYLLETLKSTRSAGVFASCALGLGRMQADEAVALIGDRLLKMERQERGVHPMMIRALGRFGSTSATRYLERYAELDGAFQPELARSTARGKKPK